MRDPVERLIITALGHLVCAPHGLPLVARASRDGLFSASRLGKQAAALCKERGLLTPLGCERRGRAERYALSESGRDFLKSALSEMLAPLAANDGWRGDVLTYLQRRHDTGTLEDCPLPVLFELGRRSCADLTIGEFHDGLRELRDREQIYLHPWTGPLYDLPEPSLALLAGHEIVYYASFAPAESRRETHTRLCHDCDA